MNHAALKLALYNTLPASLGTFARAETAERQAARVLRLLDGTREHCFTYEQLQQTHDFVHEEGYDCD
jgi:hypothetical protein